MRDSRDRRGTKRRLLAELLIAAFAILLFGAALMLYERSSRKREGTGDSGSWDEKADELADQEIQLALNERVYAYTDRLEAYLLIGTDNSSENPEAKQGYNGDLADLTPLSSRKKKTYNGQMVIYIRRTGKEKIQVRIGTSDRKVRIEATDLEF